MMGDSNFNCPPPWELDPFSGRHVLVMSTGEDGVDRRKDDRSRNYG